MRKAIRTWSFISLNMFAVSLIKKFSLHDHELIGKIWEQEGKKYLMAECCVLGKV